ncbi:DUF2777 family protein [Alkalihalobacterium chitinilyticum]|uniref:DUF2777 domain-containing protein n=1 Tax=Alkalihalobacterium chitinilyticum TaxID=2980103 RepID=A0ABT5V8T0_9BACI|nr:DUF2777 family protein [Alkalihalobacterium chitinilyticum]MDE5411850.1 DUF2777 domain-containing protein [Alkalihalobacterium chitinilyticum]
MERKQAETLVGKLVMINENEQGQYIGTLEEVITAPRKPWRGLVKIVSVETLPKPTIKNGVELGLPLYSEGETIEVSGTKIIPFEADSTAVTYKKGLELAIIKQLNYHKDKSKEHSSIFEALASYLHEFEPSRATSILKDLSLIEADDSEKTDYLYYTLENRNNSPILVEEIHKKEVPLEGCPFEFELKTSRGWVKGGYYSKWLFQAVSGKKYKLKEDKILRLNKKHLEPYELLLNELDKPALQSFEHFLKTNHLTHKQMINCHNSLVGQLLFSTEQKEFNGTNFITYKDQNDMIIIQHHYERKLNKGLDTVYDRFELTSSTGVRSIVTYTNSFTS